MGASKQEFEKMRYVIFTEPMTNEDFIKEYYDEEVDGDRFLRTNIKDWKCEPEDYEELFAEDTKFQELRKTYKESKKSLDIYKKIKRELINKSK